MHSTKKENPTSLASPNALKTWILAARPKTLIAGISPVLIGGSIAARHAHSAFALLFLCLLFSLILQIATNFANDYFDFIKGADTAARKGPLRAVQAGWIAPLTMRNAALGTMFAALLCAIPLLYRIGTSFIPLLLLALISALGYTGGKKPLGYLGLGEVLVLFFYGLVATSCTVLVLVQTLPPGGLIASIAPGCFSCALLCINNLRDAAEDKKVGKMTLIARFGPRFGQIEYILCLLLAALSPLILVLIGYPSTLFATYLFLPFALKPLKLVIQHPQPLGDALEQTARLQVIYTLTFCAALYL